jgi:hypothetical protein
VRDPEIITVNGKQYDALTGKPVVKAVSDIAPRNGINYRQPSGGGQIINDFARPVQHLVGLTPKPQGPVNNDVTAHHTHQRADDIKRMPSKSNTLMRKPLKKPDFSPKTIVQPIHKAHYLRRDSPMVINRGVPANSLRDTLVNRSQVLRSKAAEVMTNIAAEPPVNTMNVHERQIQKINSADDDQLYKAATQVINDQKAPAKVKKTKKKRGLRAKTLYILAGVVLFLAILAGTGLYFKNNLELAYDSSKSGINASVPSYLPLGYKLTSMSYHKGTGFGAVSFEYHPGHSTLDLNFYLNESSSSLDNAGLLAADVIPLVHNNYSSFSVNGLVIYHFENQYVWVNGGLLYIITDQTSLDQSTMAKIIASI